MSQIVSQGFQECSVFASCMQVTSHNWLHHAPVYQLNRFVVSSTWPRFWSTSDMYYMTTMWPHKMGDLPGITRATRMPAFWDTPRHPMITHTSDSHQIPSQNKTKSKLQISKKLPKIQILKFCKKLYTRHTFWSCWIRCMNMKWIQPKL